MSMENGNISVRSVVLVIVNMEDKRIDVENVEILLVIVSMED